ncbi:hypothetical protein V2K91_25230 [Pseudomonas alliivorans]|nr:hypothetical protein [Pseudomonas alliivorans]
MNNNLKSAIKEYYRYGISGELPSLGSMEVLRTNDLLRPVVELEHDDLIKLLFHEVSICSKESVVESFLLGLENNQPEKRAALSAFAIALNLPKHKFTVANGFQCDVCGAFKSRKRDFTILNLGRYSSGASNSGSPDELYFFLKEANESRVNSVESITSFKAVLAVLKSAVPEDTPTTIEKKIRSLKSLKLSAEQSRGLVDILGHIGVLESPEHKGFIYQFKNIGLMPRKSRSSDWSYPVDFWKGEYGVNEDAVEFWFGKYLRQFA